MQSNMAKAQALQQTGETEIRAVNNENENDENEDTLLKRLDSLMQTDQLFTDPNLNRNALAKRLKTNRTYLSDAIRDGKNGKSVAEYINSFRLAMACDLILNRPDLLISDIWAISGFASYRYFHQLFNEEYGMSPSDFRKKTKKAGL